MSDLETSDNELSRNTDASLLEELDHYRRRVRELERSLAERDRDEGQCRNDVTRLAQAFQPARIRAWYWDAESRLTRYLPLRGDVRDSLGRPASDILLAEERLLEAIHLDDRERLARVWGRANKEHRPYEIEYRIVQGDGAVRHQREIGTPEFAETGRYLGHIGTTQDITEHRAAEERLRQAQKMEAVGQLTGGVAHDFNNLLAVIMGNAELLQDRLGLEDPPLKAIQRSATRGAELTQRLLAFSRQQPLRPQVVDLGRLISSISDLLVRTLGETIEVRIETEPDLWSALADPGQVENALLNLALNARDAMPGGGRLTIKCANASLDDAYVAENFEAKAGDYVVLAVSDDGRGMAAEVKSHAFEPFFTTKEVGEGSGLGLSMVYGFARQSGGHVVIESEEGQGTTAKLYLPRAEKASRPGTAPPGERVPRGRGEVILVVEDDPDVRDLAAHMLEGLGYRVIGVPDAARARKVLADGQPVDLMLSDVVLPGGTSGPQFAKEARAAFPDLKVIFMSGYPAQSARRNGALGSDSMLLNKPFQRRQLAEALRDELDPNATN